MYEERPSSDPRIRSVWRAGGDDSGSLLEMASERWAIGFVSRVDGRLSAELVGPAAEARAVAWRAGEEYWGVELEGHVFWRGLDKTLAPGEWRPLPVDGRHVELGGVRYPVPGFDGLERLVASMAAQGVLVADPLVAAALAGEDRLVSERTLQRRFVEVAGLGRKRIEQIERARRAYGLLQEGVAPAAAAAEAGYSDQAHLTRSLRVFAGRTPRQILLEG